MNGWGPAGRASSVDPVAVRRTASEAARRAGVQVRPLDALSEMAQAESLFERVWGEGVTIPLLRTMAFTGNYVVGAWSHDHLMGASVGFMSVTGSGRRSAHLHIMGVVPPAQGSGVGFALLADQRAWAVDLGVEEITWLFDPLVRRNGWLALTKLGARVDIYLPDFFGYLNDPINRWDYTDRCLARWDLEWGSAPGDDFADETEGSAPDTEKLIAGGARLILAEGDMMRPVLAGAGWIDERPDVLLCQVPPDANAMRRVDPKKAREWLSALRGSLARAIDAGYVVTAMTSGGCYVLTCAA